MNTIKNILLSVLTEAQNKNFPVGKTQLVKYLYLIELEYFRQTKSRLTDLEWKFYHYGPYAVALEPILTASEFLQQDISFGKGKTYKRFAVAEPLPAYKDIIDTKVSLIIKRVVGQWGNKQLQELLDYVYFETEPMQAVEHRGEILDISTVLKEQQPETIPLKASQETEKKIAELRKRFGKRLIQLGEIEPSKEKTTESYKQALQAWDEEENSEWEGIGKIRITITKPSQSSGAQGN